MRRVLLILAAVLLAMVGLARADDLDQATQDAIDARRQLDYALANQRDAAFRAQSAVSDLQTIRTILDDPAAVQHAQTDAFDAARVVNEQTQILAAARVRLDAAAAAVDRYRAQARETFESSPAFQQVTQQLQTAQSDFDAAAQWSNLSLDQDPQFQELAATVQFAEARVRWLRENATDKPEALANASRAWIDAQNLLNNYLQWWFNNDAGIADARAQFAAAQRDSDALNARFETDLGADLQFIQLTANQNVEQKTVESLNEDLRLASEARHTADERARIMQERYHTAVAQLEVVQQELTASRAIIEQSGWAVDNANSRARWAQDQQDRAWIERDRAGRDLILLQDDYLRQRIARDRDIRDDDNRDRAAANRDRDRQQRQADFERDRNRDSQTSTRRELPQTPPLPVAPRHDSPSPPPRNPTPVVDPRQDQQQQQRSAQADADRRQRDDNNNDRARNDDSRSSSRSTDSSSSSSRTRDPDPNDRGSRYQR